MPLRACCHEQAAGRLLSADAMLAACPHHEGAKCARVEVPLPLLLRAAAPMCSATQGFPIRLSLYHHGSLESHK